MRSTADKRHQTARIACWLMAQGHRQLKMVTGWPEGTPGLHTGAVRFAQTTDIATGGRIKVEVFPSGALVRPFETFDAVGAGVADSPRCWRSQIGVE
jgi:TRAP-type mannitol/chloroaromatic compound transport system substrate-binding protein